MGRPGPRLSAGAGAAVALAVRRHLRDLPPGPVLVGVSGGADSLALLAGALDVADGLGRAVGAVCVDHGWRPQTADVVRRAARAALALGASPVRVVRVVPQRHGPGAGGAEEAARTARLAALDAVAARDEAVAVLLGHTLDDQAEQVLLGLARGSGTRSLAGMPAVRDGLLRPLLGVRRAVVREATVPLAPLLAPLGLPWEDPSNTDPVHLRPRVRHDVVPALEAALGEGAVRSLARTADLARADADALDGWAGAVVAGLPDLDAPDGVPVAPLAGLPGAVRRRCLRLLALRAGAGALTAAHTAALDALVDDWHGQGPVALPGGVGVRRSSGPDGCGRLRATPAPRPREDPHGRP
ncbi:tRNA lysidine(34) synthetase TilS [Aquipuribacter nitratireducens]|uniref:tRNA(Ile)-lysidine synthase n=1 Tax=Aquipuribacter nitratireducens TaxID=650104 RepID=A0ABW0GWR4_9MICO